MSDEPIRAWHFTDGWTLRDGRELRPRLYTMRKPIVMCAVGYHASERILDALEYAPGSVISRVEVSGKILREEDKLCASRRRVLWSLDIAPVLHEFACRVAEQALRTHRVTHRAAWAAIEAKRAWLRGEIDDEALSTARYVAWSAAASAAWNAAWSARAAAWSAASTAMDAAAAAAAAAATAAGADQNELLTRMVEEQRKTVEAVEEEK